MSCKYEISQYRPNVGILLINGQGKVFAGRRDAQDTHWQMPQGGIEQDEDPVAAAYREMQEEVGTHDARYIRSSEACYCYDFPEYVLKKQPDSPWMGQRQHWVAFTFLGTDADINIRTSHPEFIEWRWYTMAALIQEVISFKRDVYRQVAKEFADLLLP